MLLRANPTEITLSAMVNVAILSSLSKNTIFFILPFSFSSKPSPLSNLFFSLSHPNDTLFQTFFSSSNYLLYILFSLCLTQTTLFLNLSFFFKLSSIHSFFSLSHPNYSLFQTFFFFFTLSSIHSFFLIKKNQKIKAYAAGAKNTPLSRAERTRCAQTAFRFSGFPPYFFNAPSAEANPFHGSPAASPTPRLFATQRRLSPPNKERRCQRRAEEKKKGWKERKKGRRKRNSAAHSREDRRCRRRAAKEDPTSSERALRNPCTKAIKTEICLSEASSFPFSLGAGVLARAGAVLIF